MTMQDYWRKVAINWAETEFEQGQVDCENEIPREKNNSYAYKLGYCAVTQPNKTTTESGGEKK